jgi:hypothetical protein
MRARELLQEDYNSDLVNELGNILISAKAIGMGDVDLQNVVDQMDMNGYSVDTESLMHMLQNDPRLNTLVTNVTPDMIKMAGQAAADDPTQDSAEKVADMAQQATKIGK